MTDRKVHIDRDGQIFFVDPSVRIGWLRGQVVETDAADDVVMTEGEWAAVFEAVAHRKLPCCNQIEQADLTVQKCYGTMTLDWPEFVCNTCHARCGGAVHHQCNKEE